MDTRKSVSYTFWLFYRLTHNFIYNYVIFNIVKFIPRRYRYMKFKQFSIMAFFSFILVQFFVFDNLTYNKLTTPIPSLATLNKPALNNDTSNSTILKIPSEAEFRMNFVKNKLDKIAKHSQRWDIMKFLNEVEPLAKLTDKVHIFYQAAFGNIHIDGKWRGWDHGIPFIGIHEDLKPNSQEAPIHNPPTDIASNFYPLLGCYSSRDPRVINTHFKEIKEVGIGVVIVSWLPSENIDFSDEILNLLLEIAKIYDLKIALQIETYHRQHFGDLSRLIKLIIEKHSNNKSFYKLLKNGQHLPVFYILHSYRFPVDEWRELLAVEGEQSVRGTSYDAIFIGHLRDSNNRFQIQKGHFDGFYTYFASNSYSYGSTWKNWNTLAQFAKKHNMLFFPSVGPGYIDSNARSSNTVMTRHRTRGHYYQVAWRAALASHAFGVSISSFNHWQDGTQIEPAQPHNSYLDYQPEGPYFYLNLTRFWVKQFVMQNADKID